MQAAPGLDSKQEGAEDESVDKLSTRKIYGRPPARAPISAETQPSAMVNADRKRAVHVNAMSTRIRHFGAVNAGENRSMSVVVGLENPQDQRLGVQVVEMHKLLESLGFWLIT